MTDQRERECSSHLMENQQLALNKVTSRTIVSDDVTYHPYLSGLTDLGKRACSTRTMENQQLVLNITKTMTFYIT